MPQSIHRKTADNGMTLDVSNGQYDIRIYNSGAEITMDQREEIFDRFIRPMEIKDSFGIGLHLEGKSFVCIREPYAY